MTTFQPAVLFTMTPSYPLQFFPMKTSPQFHPKATLHNSNITDSINGTVEGGGGGSDGDDGVVGKVGYLMVLSVVTVLGNILVIVAITTIRAMHRVSNYFLISLAAADLMVGVFTIPLFILWLLNHELFTSDLACHFILLSCLFVMVASQLNVVVVTVERYAAVCHPFLHRRVLLSKPHVVTVTIAALWLLSLVSTALSSLSIDTENHECSYYRYFDRNFLLVAIVVGVFLPFTLIVVLNVLMLVKIRSSCVFQQGMYQMRRGSGGMGGMSKATVMMMIVCSLFLLAWTPFFITTLIHSFCSHCHLQQALDTILLFAFTNSAWNPVVYALCNLMFRRAYAHLLTMYCCQRHASIPSPGSARRDSVFFAFYRRPSL